MCWNNYISIGNLKVKHEEQSDSKKSSIAKRKLKRTVFTRNFGPSNMAPYTRQYF